MTVAKQTEPSLDGLVITRQELAEAERLARRAEEEYGVAVPPQLLIQVGPRSLEAYVAGLSANLLALLQPDYFVARPTGYKVAGGAIYFKYPNKVKAVARLPAGREARKAEFRRLLDGLHVVSIDGGRPQVAKVIPYEMDVEGAQRVVEALGEAGALAAVFGLTAEALRFYWWRPLPFLTFPVNPPKAFIVEISPPATGKTHMAVLASRVFKVYYTTEAPSLANLVYDFGARVQGAVFTSDAVIFDEAEKWHSRVKDDLKQLMPILLTGIEQGVWTRSKREGVTVSKYVGLAMYGNVRESSLQAATPREAVAQVMAKMLHYNADALVSRATVALYTDGMPTVDSTMLQDFVLKPAVARGVIQLLNDIMAGLQAPQFEGNMREKARKAQLWCYLRAVWGVEDPSVVEKAYINPQEAL